MSIDANIISCEVHCFIKHADALQIYALNKYVGNLEVSMKNWLFIKR